MSNKSSRTRIEQALPFIYLYLLIKGEAITNMESEIKGIEDEIEKILDEKDSKLRGKLDNRIAKLNNDSGIFNLIKSNISGHKFILMLYYLTIEIDINSQTILSCSLEVIMNKFLVVEGECEKPDNEVFKIRSSAEKQAKKLFITLKTLGYYNTL